MLSLIDKRIAAVLVAAAAVIFLVRLSQPAQVVFDEVHFGKFVTAYCCSGARFFDIHPPHAKLLISAGAYVGGYRGGFSFEHIGQPYGLIQAAPLRFVSAFAGMMIPLLMYMVLRLAKVTPLIALLGGLAVLFDNALVVQSRLIALDSILLVATLGSLAAFLWALPDIKARWWLLLVAGGLAGLAAGTKFTGLAILGLIGVTVLLFLVQTGKQTAVRQWFSVGLLVLVGALVVYVAGWALHFSLLTKPGSGDAWGVPTGDFWSDLTHVHQQMLTANYNLEATHPYSSPWWSWPLMRRPVFYWSGSDGGWIYFLGNPVVWWGGSVLFVVALLAVIRQKRIGSIAGWMFLGGYILSYVPFMRVPRALFLYHYLTPLVFSLLFGLWWLNRTKIFNVQFSIFKLRSIPTWYWVTVAAIVGGFVLFSPLTYGFAAPEWQQFLVWLPTWR